MSSRPDPAQIAAAFRAFVPDERYRHFLLVLNTSARERRRLIAWQEFLWNRFVAARPDVPTAFEDISAALRICPVHLCGMSLEAVPLRRTDLMLPPWLERDRDTLFPFANAAIDVLHDPPEEAATRVVPVCADCRRALDAWNARHRIPFGMLRFSTDPNWRGDYFTVCDSFEISRGIVLTGIAPDPDDPWPAVGQIVRLSPPAGEPLSVTVLDTDPSITRSCFSDGSAQRAILVRREDLGALSVRGMRVRAVPQAEPD